MARVLQPVMRRTYDHNPRGSSTATVRMAAQNPFEGRVSMATRSAMPGMGAIDLTQIPTNTAGGMGFNVDWGNIIEKGAENAIKIGSEFASNRIDRLYGPKPVPLQAPAAVLLPGQPGATRFPVYGVPAPSKLPWIIGGAAVLGAVAFVVLRKKKR